MDIQIQTQSFQADQKLKNYIQEKLSKLTKFYHKIESVNVHLKLESKSHQLNNKIVDITLNVPGSQIHIQEVDRKFEKSTNRAVSNLKRQLKKYKSKLKG